MVLENGTPKPTPGFGDWGVAGLIGFEPHVSRETLGQIAGRERKRWTPYTRARCGTVQNLARRRSVKDGTVPNSAPPCFLANLSAPSVHSGGAAVGSSRCHARFRILARFGLLSLTQCKCRLTLGAPTSAAML
jgi:hypothetical protein